MRLVWSVVLSLLVAAVGFVVYRSHHRSPIVCTGCGLPVPVLVAKTHIQKGTLGNVIAESQLYTVRPVRRSEVGAGVIVDYTQLNGEVAMKDIQRGQRLTTSDFVSATVGLSSRPNVRALVLKQTSPKEIGTQITADSHVDVWVATNSHGSHATLHRLFQNLYVLKVSTSGGGTVMLRVTPQQAGTLLRASQNDRLLIRLYRTKRSPICTRGLVTVEADPRGLRPLTANPIGRSVTAALRYVKRRDKPQVVRADLATADHQRGREAKFECGSRVWRRTVVVDITLRALAPSASLSEKVFFVGRFKHGYRVWQVVH